MKIILIFRKIVSLVECPAASIAMKYLQSEEFSFQPAKNFHNSPLILLQPEYTKKISLNSLCKEDYTIYIPLDIQVVDNVASDDIVKLYDKLCVIIVVECNRVELRHQMESFVSLSDYYIEKLLSDNF